MNQTTDLLIKLDFAIVLFGLTARFILAFVETNVLAFLPLSCFVSVYLLVVFWGGIRGRIQHTPFNTVSRSTEEVSVFKSAVVKTHLNFAGLASVLYGGLLTYTEVSVLTLDLTVWRLLANLIIGVVVFSLLSLFRIFVRETLGKR